MWQPNDEMQRIMWGIKGSSGERVFLRDSNVIKLDSRSDEERLTRGVDAVKMAETIDTRAR